MDGMRKRIFIGMFVLSIGLLGIEWGLTAHENEKHISSSTPSEEVQKASSVEQQNNIIELVNRQKI